MTRADALAELIDRVDASATLPVDVFEAAGVDPRALGDCYLRGSLDAVARLEAPLRERDWTGPLIHPPEDEDPCWEASWVSEHNQDIEARAYSEARARLLAVLRALLHEATHG